MNLWVIVSLKLFIITLHMRCARREEGLSAAETLRKDFRASIWDKQGYGFRTTSSKIWYSYSGLITELRSFYTDKIEKFTQHEKVDHTGEVLSGDYAEVLTAVMRPNDWITLNFRLIDKGKRLCEI